MPPGEYIQTPLQSLAEAGLPSRNATGEGELVVRHVCLQVEEVYGRDVRAEDVPGIISGLRLWCESLLTPLTTGADDKALTVW